MSQIKVHGSTMLEDFQYEFDQSSAEVREVTDFMMKKEHKPATGGGGAVAAGSTNGNAVPLHGAAAGATANAPGIATTPGGVPKSQATTPQSATPSNEGGVEHRPHAATVATVPVVGKRPGGGGSVGIGGSAGAGTVTVEDIVRGVPAEMVVPASTACVGPIGTDGLCRGEVLTDGSTGDAAGESSASLGAKITTMGGTAASGIPNRFEGGGGGGVNGGSDLEGGGSGVGGSLGQDVAAGGAGSVGLGGAVDPASGVRESGAVHVAGQGEAGRPPGELVVGGRTADSAVVGVAGAAAEGVGGIAEGETAVGKKEGPAGDEEPPPRKGIIHSTMEAISKAVHRGDGSKPKDNGGAKLEGGALNGADAGAASRCSAQEDAAVGCVGGTAVAPSSGGVDGAVKHVVGGGTNAPEVDSMTATQQNAAGAGGNGVPAGGQQSNGGGGATSGAGLSEGQWDASGNTGPGSDAVGGETIIRVGERTDVDGALGSAASSETYPGSAEGTALSDTAASADFVASQAGVREGDRLAASSTALPSGAHGGPAGGKVNLAGSASSESNLGTDEYAKLAASLAGGEGTHVPQATVGVQTDLSSLRESTPAGEQAGATTVFPAEQGTQAAEPIVRLEEVNSAALAAACLERLSFAEFREEVLARTQHAQQSAGGGVAIGGQYESIFKTLMNKIKTLEINQSLFSLYIGTFHR